MDRARDLQAVCICKSLRMCRGASGDRLHDFWLDCLTDLKKRGLDDVFIVCVDGLTGFADPGGLLSASISCARRRHSGYGFFASSPVVFVRKALSRHADGHSNPAVYSPPPTRSKKLVAKNFRRDPFRPGLRIAKEEHPLPSLVGQCRPPS